MTILKHIIATALFFAGLSCMADTINVADYGAVGDGTNIVVSTTSGSAIITTTNVFTVADVGKVMCLFNCGTATSGTNYQDSVATVISISGGTNVTLNRIMGLTSVNVTAFYGTQNSAAFQSAVDAAGTNTTINVPGGNFLFVSSQALDTNFVMSQEFETHPSVTIKKGGIDIIGAGTNNTILTGCGAWQLKGSWPYRGFLFAFQGPVSNDYPLVMENMTLDGGVQVGYTGNGGWPANTTNGDGWDVTHDAVFDIPPIPIQSYRIFRNLRIRNWRGEQLKSGIALTDGFILISNCSISDGDASGFNFNFTHTTIDCVFSNLFQGEEFYEGYCNSNCLFANNVMTNIYSHGLVINGALSTHPPPYYIMVNNLFSAPTNVIGTIGIATTPAQNVIIASNQFFNYSTAIGLGIAGYQGSAYGNSNFVIAYNSFSNCGNVFQVLGNGYNSVLNTSIFSNTSTSGVFAYGYGWSTNVSLSGNIATNSGIDSTALQGQWYLDDLSDQLFPHSYNDFVFVTNVITYALGSKAVILMTHPSSIYQIDDSSPNQIPPSALLRVSMNPAVTLTAKVYLSSSSPSLFLSLHPGQSRDIAWTGNAWQPVGNSARVHY